MRIGVYALGLMLSCGSVAEAATFCATSGNQLNIALETAAFNQQDDTIKVATGTHITDIHAPGAYQWSFRPVVGTDYEGSLTISGGWNAANNCQTQSTLDPAQTVLDARYWGPVFTAEMVFDDFTGTLQISNLTFYRGESNNSLSDAGILVISERGTITIDNILVTGNRSGANSGRIGQFSINTAGTLKVRNSQFLNNSFTHSFSGGVRFLTQNGAVGMLTNNSISGNTATLDRMGLEAIGIVTLSNNAFGGNSSTDSPSYDFISDAPTSLTLVNNHFQTVSITNGAPFSETDTTTGDPDWTLVGSRMVPDAVSALRDSGDNTPTGGVPNIDFSGQPRIVNLTIDRGAVEADAPAGVAIGPLVTAASPADGSTTVLQGNPGEFVGTQLTFNVSGGTAPGTTKVECSITSGTIGLASSGETVAVGGSITPIDVGFTLTNEVQNGVITCELTRDFAGISYLTYNFVGAPPGGPAIFDSDPKPYPDPASTIDLTPGLAVIVGTDVLPKSLKLYNIAEFGDSDMQVFCGPSGGSNPQITITPETINGDLISPQGSLEVIFDCDTSTPGSWFANYGCSYDLDETDNPAVTDGTATFRVECDVRPPPETQVETTPPSGTTTTQVVEPNGSANFDFIFAEVSPDPDPPDDANLLNCSIVDDTYGAFSIQSPGFPGGPYPIVNGSPVAVQVLGTDSSGQQLYTATLHCEYTDTDHLCPYKQVNVDQGQGPQAPECGMADFPLELRVRSDAKFRVTKDFTDDNPREVNVYLSCNTGLPLEQIKAIHEGYDVVFVIDDFDSGELDCDVFEDVPDGYSPTYEESIAGDASLSDLFADAEGCHFEDIEFGDYQCQITNTPDPVDIDVEKRWIFENAGGDKVNTYYKLTLFCDGEIVDADEWCPGGEGPAGQPEAQESWCKVFEGNDSDLFTAEVIPDYPYTHCYVVEDVYDDAVEVDNDCQDLQVSAGNGDHCLIVNTVFFEGIPTLSQWGMAILALLMLGVGLVGFRRFA